MGRNVEAYIDDISSQGARLPDIQETFSNLRRFNIKLNPKKCTVPGGKFLGVMVSRRKMEANPDQVQAILNMQPPRNLKEVQCLNGRIAALSQSLYLKGGRKVLSSKSFARLMEWTPACEARGPEIKYWLHHPSFQCHFLLSSL